MREAHLTPPGFVPEGLLRIARRFSAGNSAKRFVPKGRLRSLEQDSAVPAGLISIPIYPALKRRAIFWCPFGTKERPE